MKQLTLILVVLMLAFGVSAVSADVSADVSAQEEPGTVVTLTEAQINQFFSVREHPRHDVSDVSVDLQPGQAVITATIAFENGNTFVTKSTLVPSVNNGLVEWTVASILVGDEPASDQTLSIVNSIIASSWRRWFREQYGPHRIESLTISEDAITYVVGERQNDNNWELPPFDIVDGIATITFSEEWLNETYRVSVAPRPRIEDVYIDLQPGQVLAYITYVPFNGDPIPTVSTLVPTVADGDVTWTVTTTTLTESTLNEEAASAIREQTDAILDRVFGLFDRERRDRYVTAIEITDDAMFYSFQVERERPSR